MIWQIPVMKNAFKPSMISTDWNMFVFQPLKADAKLRDTRVLNLCGEWASGEMG